MSLQDIRVCPATYNREENMTVKEIIQHHLVALSYDGLVNEIDGCTCEVADIMRTCHDPMNCRPFRQDMQESPPPPVQMPDCPKCGAHMALRSGRNGNFWGCTKYPDCKGSLAYK
jgi:hypothetical protein